MYNYYIKAKVIELLQEMDWRVFIIDWTEKSFGNIRSNVDADVLNRMEQKIEDDDDDDNDDDDDKDNDNDNDKHDVDKKKEQEDDSDVTDYDDSDDTDYDEDDDMIEKEEKKEEETFSDSEPPRQYAKIKCSFQIICTEANYILDHSLVPKGESHEYLLPLLADVIETNMVNCKTEKKGAQIRTDGIDKNKNVAEYVLDILEKRYLSDKFEEDDGAILLSKDKFIYNFTKWKILRQLKVYIFIAFIFCLCFIYIYIYIYIVCCMWFSSRELAYHHQKR